jgi:hypothetical protein
MIRLLTVVLLIAGLPAIAGAQARPSTPLGRGRPPRTPRFEIAAGGGMAGGVSLGERDASLRSNGVTPSPFRLFSTDTQIDPSARVEARLGYRLSSRLTIEGTLAVARPSLTSSLGADVESAASVEATSTLTEYVIDGGARWRLFTSTRRRWTPFVSGGAGVARHVHEGQALIESGVDGYAGGGLLYSLGARTGLRFDGALHFLRGGITDGFDASPRGALSGSIFITF